MWAFHGAMDTTVSAFTNFGSVPLVNAVNSANPKVRARITVYPALAHDAWTPTYNGQGQSMTTTNDDFDRSIYDWMLAYKKE